MSTYMIEDTLHGGFIDRWLVAGPRALEVADLARFSGDDFKLQIIRHYDSREPGVVVTAEELADFEADGVEVRWRAYRCAEDHFVERSAFYHTCHHLRTWAYARIVAPDARTVTFFLTVNAPADVWINGQHTHRTEVIQHQIPHTTSFEAALQAGENEILVRFEVVAVRECPYVMALRVADGDGWPVRLPTSVPHQELRAKLERIFDRAYLEREVYGRDDLIAVRWPDDLADSQQICVRLQDPQGWISFEGLPSVKAGATQVIGKGAQFRDGDYRVVLMAHPEAHYLQNVRVTRELPLHVLGNSFSSQPYGTPETRRVEALEDAAGRSGVYAEIATMELGRWPEVKTAALLEAIGRIEQREDCSDFYLVGLLGALIRYGDNAAFPAELRAALERCALGFRYWLDDPGADAMCFWSENHQILFHACEVLAGQRFADAQFATTGQNGGWHRERGERLALRWLRLRAASGFREWDSNTYFEHDVLALVHLADLAETDELRELAAVVLDKLLFTMALNSHRGVFGSTHGRAYAAGIKGGRRELTSGMGRLLWGLGNFNSATLGSVALACARSYTLPGVVAEIATARVEELWSRERHRQELAWEYDRATGTLDVNKTTYRSSDGMLCSAQDHHPGAAGVQQHIWQATLDQDAVLFVSHPPCVSEENSHRPGFWHGNVTLPRVAQWYDALIDVRNIPDDAWLGWSHCYFPTFACDEYLLEGGWAFARRGDGYVAVTASTPLRLITEGPGAYRELRADGRQVVWVCQLGRAARDGDFTSFRQQVLASDLSFDGLQVRYRALRGEELTFGWGGTFLVDDVEQPLQFELHYDSPVCTCELGAPSMGISGWSETLLLDFTAGTSFTAEDAEGAEETVSIAEDVEGTVSTAEDAEGAEGNI